MVSIDEQFSEAARQDLLDRVSARILASVIGDLCSNAAWSLSVEEYLQSVRHIIEAAMQFDDSHARMRLLAARNGTTVVGPSPYGEIAQSQLRAAIDAVLDDIGRLIAERTPPPGGSVSQLVAHEKKTSDWLVRRRYGERDVQHGLEWDGECQRRDSAASLKMKSGHRQRVGRKRAPVNRAMEDLARRQLTKIRSEFASEAEINDELELFLGQSAEDLRPGVNQVLRDWNYEPVSAKTISRQACYRSWARHRKRTACTAAAADCGPAFIKPGDCEVDTNHANNAELKAGSLMELSPRRLGGGGRRRSDIDRAAEEFARDHGVTLDDAD